MAFKIGVKSIQTAGYNGERTVFKIPTEKKSLDITLTRDSEIFGYKQSDVGPVFYFILKAKLKSPILKGINLF